MRRSIAVIVALWLVFCGTSVRAAAAVPGNDPLGAAAAALERGDTAGCLAELRRTFETGYPTPGDVFADPRFSELREDPAARGAWRPLMRKYALESRIAMVPPGEPGQPMLIRGTLVRSTDGASIPDAVLEIYHTDETGRYERAGVLGGEAPSRLFCFVRSDAQGRFEVRTIRPGPYPGAPAEGAHVHYLVRVAGYRPDELAFHPYDHPRDPEQRKTALARGKSVSTVHEEAGQLLVDVTLAVVPLGN